MSNSLAIAAVTSSLRYVLQRTLQRPHPGQVGGAGVTTLRPDDLDDTDLAGTTGVNVFCYLATPNQAWNLTDLPTRRTDGSLAHRPVAAIDLHYLITCYGDDAELEPQRLLGRVVAALKETSVLSREVVQAARDLYGGVAETAFLTAADLDEEVELVKLSPTQLSLEEMSKLWGVLDTPYLLSLTYLATVVLISADARPTTALPVRARTVTVNAAGPPRLVDAVTEPAGSAAGPGSTLRLLGGGLLAGPGETTQVRIGPATLAPAAGSTGSEVQVLLDETVPAGVHAVRVVHLGDEAGGPRVRAASGSVPLVVRPAVGVGAVGADEVTLPVIPPLQSGQRVEVSLARLDVGTPGHVRLDLPPVAEDDAPLGDVVLARADVPDGTWLVRILVDGVESLPELDGDTYGAPALTVPP